MNVLITGAGGFIGSALAQRLAILKPRAKIHLLMRRYERPGNVDRVNGVNNGTDGCGKFRIVIGDMVELGALDEATRDIDVVYHLAAKTSEKRSESKESYATNVVGTRNLVAACLKNRVKHLVVVSSQSTKRARRGVYGETKRLADIEVSKISAHSKLKYTIVKPALVYGPGSRGLFAKIFRLIEKLPVIPIVGSGDYFMQPIYVDDLCEALVRVALNPRTFNKIYDLAGENRISFNQLVSNIQRVCGTRKRVIHIPYSLTHAGARGLSWIVSNPPITTDNLLGIREETGIDLGPAKRDFDFHARSFYRGLQDTVWGRRDSTKVQVGIIGLGKMGLLHGSIVNFLGNAQLCGLFDVDAQAKNQAYSLNIKAPFYSNLQKFLDETRPDGVIISIPPAFTLPTIKEVAGRNIHFLVEKPLSDSLSNAKEIVDLARKHRLIGSVGYMYAHKAIIKKLDMLLGQRVIGRVKSFRGTAYITQVLSPKKGWRYSKKTAGGGCVSLHGTHLLYILYHLFGMPTKLRSHLEFPYSSVEDKAHIELRYHVAGRQRGGMRDQKEMRPQKDMNGKEEMSGDLLISWSKVGYPKLAISLRIEGDNGIIELEDGQIVVNLVSARGSVQQGRSSIRSDDLPTSEFELGGEGYYEEDRAFVEAIAGLRIAESRRKYAGDGSLPGMGRLLLRSNMLGSNLGDNRTSGGTVKKKQAIDMISSPGLVSLQDGYAVQRLLQLIYASYQQRKEMSP